MRLPLYLFMVYFSFVCRTRQNAPHTPPVFLSKTIEHRVAHFYYNSSVLHKKKEKKKKTIFKISKIKTQKR